MERDSSAPRGTTNNGGTASEPAAAAVNQQDQLRQALLAAADEEAAAIVEQARRDITVAVRRARRDLHLIRAQLQLCGVEMPAASTSGSIEDGRSSLDEGVPHGAIAVGRTDSLRHVVTEASQELSQLTATVSAAAPSVAGRMPAAASRSPQNLTRSRFFIGACAVIGIIAGGAFGWMLMGGADRFDASETSEAAANAEAVTGSPASDARTGNVVMGSSAARPELTATRSSRIVLQTIRPVWMRIDVDGSDDVGRLYPQGTIRELLPTRDVVIRAGDAGAVLVGVAGESPTPLGQAGQVLTRRISVDQPRASSPVTSAEEPPRPEAPAQETTGGRPAAAPVAQAIPPDIAQPNPVLPDVQREASAGLPGVSGLATGQTHAEILAKHERWLDAYSRGDGESIRTLTAEGFSVRDERSGAQKTGSSAQEPDVSDVRIDVAGVGAVLTGRLRTVIDGVPNEALLSEVWVRDGQQRWALMGVRITPVVQGATTNGPRSR
jgi:hypothetical protein